MPSNHPQDANASRPSDDATKLAERLAYLGLSADDQKRLQSLAVGFQGFATELVESFYRHLFSFKDSASFLHDPALVARLKQAQQEHFLSLVTAEWDASYVERRLRVGQTHAHVGIDPELFLGAHSQYVQESFRHYLTEDGSSIPPRIESLMSLLKVVFLDLGLTLDAYFTHSTQTMRQALDMYLKANIELRQFAHLTSHDLKTPLATVANFCDEALDEFGEQMPVEARRLIESAKQRTFRMSTMIDELLSATISFDPAEQMQETSSQAIISEALDRLRPLIAQKQISVIISPDLPVVWADPVRLRESFYNLLSNAVKFVPAVRGTITVAVATEAENYVFIISDNGSGIPRDDMNLIFAPFRRSSLHKDQSGSGLGLYFTKSMIEQQGGTIWVESKIGVGSQFYVRLPRQPDV